MVGVDLVPDNTYFAARLAQDLGAAVRFVTSDIMELMDNHQGQYDLVFTSDGAVDGRQT